MTDKEALKLELEALEHGLDYAKSEQYENAQRFKGYEHLAPDDAYAVNLIEQAITAIKARLAQPEQEPVAYCDLENWLTGKVWVWKQEDMNKDEALEKLVREDEREACAKLFDDRNTGTGFYEPHEPAEIIRARGKA